MTHADEARRIVAAMKTCQTNHPEKWLEPIAAALAAAWSDGRRAGIEEAIGPVETLRKSMEVAEQAFGPWTHLARRVEPTVMAQCAIDAIRALLPAAGAEPEPSGISGELPAAKTVPMPSPGTMRMRYRFGAEPAAKCAKCGGSGSIQGPCPDKVSGTGMYAAPGISCAVYHAVPCPSCSAKESAK